MKTLLNNPKDWKRYQTSNFENNRAYIQSESEANPLEYPCIVVETKWIKGCEHSDDQFVRFVYLNDFKKEN